MNEANDKFPKLSWKVTPEMDWSAERLQFTTAIDGISRQVCREILDFKDKTVRDTLIALGWTPPFHGSRCSCSAPHHPHD